MKAPKILFLFIAGMFLIAACGSAGATPDASGELVIIQEDVDGMRFVPEDIVLTAGQRVRLVIQNDGEKLHEFMVGRNVVRTDDGAPNGFEVDFFEGLDVETMLGDGAMLMIDGETIMMGGMDMGEDMAEGEMDMEGEDEHEEGEHEEGEHEEAHMGWMVMSDVGSGETVIEFTVPEDAVGEWEMACFEDDGTHYEDGMRGTLTVVDN